MESNKTVYKSSFPFFQILTLIFVYCKVTGTGSIATWSWWAVLSPLWGPFLLMVILLVIVGALYYFANK